MKRILLVISHLAFLAIGFALGIYLLPILTAPDAPSASQLQAAMGTPTYTAEFSRQREDSDALHWGEGVVSIGEDVITLEGKLSPGPDFRLYLSPVFIETERDFELNRSKMLQVGEVKTFENFLVDLPDGTRTADYNTVIVWCEAFGQFITSAKYQP